MNSKQSSVSLALVVGLGLALAFVLTMSQPLSAEGEDSCFVEYTGDGITDYSSPDASAIQQAVDAASAGTTIRIAGDCMGVGVRAGLTQTVYITKSLALRGGYDPADWLGDPDPLNPQATLGAQWKGRVLYVKGVGVEVSLSHLDMFGGDATGLGGGPFGFSVGGAIYALSATLDISESAVFGSTAPDYGGGIYFQGGKMSISHSVVSQNSSWDGGSIFAYGPLVMSNIGLSRGAAEGLGGGLFNAGQVVTITNSTIYSNTAGQGGGIYDSFGILNLVNSTLSGNSAADSGGAIYTYQGTVHLNFCTGSGNSALRCGGFGNDGGNATWANTIMANSVGADCCKANGVITDSGFNLVRTGDCGFPEADDPRLGPRSYNPPGNTTTHALLDESPALDGVTDPKRCTLATDQRGVARPEGAYCDIGAFEREVRCWVEHTGDNVTDFGSVDAYAVQQAVDAVATGGAVKVAGYCAGVRGREAMTQTVYISKALTLMGGYTTTNWLAASDPQTHPTILDARDQGRVLNIDFSAAQGDGQSTESGVSDVVINGLTVRGGNGSSQACGPFTDCGGGIQVENARVTVSNVDVVSNTANAGGGIHNDWDSTIYISDSTLSDNLATEAGGGLANVGAATVENSLVARNTLTSTGEWALFGAGIYNLKTLTVTNCTLSGNIGGGLVGNGVTAAGGAIHNNGNAWVSSSTLSGNSAFGGAGIRNDGMLEIWNSTISGNVAAQGAGIHNNGEASSHVMHCTIADNSAAFGGGGIFNFGTLTLTNSIAANSREGEDCYNADDGTFRDVGYNLIEDNKCSSQDAVEPKLGPLQINAPGDTATHALLEDSPAIDGVADSSLPLTSVDQRGVKRPQGRFCDIGAYEAEQEMGKVFLPLVLRARGP